MENIEINKLIDKATELVPNLDVNFSGNSGFVTLQGILLFQTQGYATREVIQGFLYGLILGKHF